MRAHPKTPLWRYSLGVSGAMLFSVLAFRAAAAETYTLRMKFREGAISRYQTNAEIITRIPLPTQSEPLKSTVEVNLLQEMRVYRLLEKGGAEVATKTLSGQMLRDGKPFASPEPKPILISYDALGDIHGVRGALAPSRNDFFAGVVGSGAMSFLRAYLPPRPVSLGQEWSQTVKMPGLPGAGAATVKAKLLRLEKVGRFQTARIHAKLALPLKIFLTASQQVTKDPKKATSTLSGTLNIDFDTSFALSDGKIIKSGGSGKGRFALAPFPAPKGKPAPPAPGIEMEMHIGSNLLE